MRYELKGLSKSNLFDFFSSVGVLSLVDGNPHISWSRSESYPVLRSEKEEDEFLDDLLHGHSFEPIARTGKEMSDLEKEDIEQIKRNGDPIPARSLGQWIRESDPSELSNPVFDLTVQNARVIDNFRTLSNLESHLKNGLRSYLLLAPSDHRQEGDLPGAYLLNFDERNSRRSGANKRHRATSLNSKYCSIGGLWLMREGATSIPCFADQSPSFPLWHPDEMKMLYPIWERELNLEDVLSLIKILGQSPEKAGQYPGVEIRSSSIEKIGKGIYSVGGPSVPIE